MSLHLSTFPLYNFHISSLPLLHQGFSFFLSFGSLIWKYWCKVGPPPRALLSPDPGYKHKMTEVTPLYVWWGIVPQHFSFFPAPIWTRVAGGLSRRLLWRMSNGEIHEKQFCKTFSINEAFFVFCTVLTLLSGFLFLCDVSSLDAVLRNRTPH